MKVTPVLAFFIGALYYASPSDCQNVEWIRQLGTSGSDLSTGVSADGLGNVYISGVTYGNLGGILNGDRDAFVSKFNSSGSLLWTQQFGTNDIDEALCVSADGL